MSTNKPMVGRTNHAFINALMVSICNSLPVTEMLSRRGCKYSASKYYQIRVTPLLAQSAEHLLHQLETLLHIISKKFGILISIKANTLSHNSKAYSSISFNHNDTNFEIILARGMNKGESFEMDIVKNLQEMILGNANEKSCKVISALTKIRPDINIDNIINIYPRRGTTKRSSILTSKSGEIIADLFIELKDGTTIPISIKNQAGVTVANFGIVGAINNDFTVNNDSPVYEKWLKPFNLDNSNITNGLLAYCNNQPVLFEDIIKPLPIDTTSIKALLKEMWGFGYIYLREDDTTNFVAIDITEPFLDSLLLDSLVVSEIRYPSHRRKQISIAICSPIATFKIEVRNTAGGVKPTQINMQLLKMI